MAFNNSLYGGQYLYSPQNQYTRYEPQPQMQMQMPQQTQPGYSLKGRPVGSIDEARASIIDFDGTIFYFPNIDQKRIYTKKINLDGTSSLETYQLVDTPQAAGDMSTLQNTFVTNDTFNRTIQELMTQINNLKGVNNYEQSTTNNSEQFNF